MNRKSNIKSTGCNEKLFLTDDTYKFLWFHNSEAVKNDAYFSIRITQCRNKEKEKGCTCTLREVADNMDLTSLILRI